jgi:hypothetical protein
LFLVFDGFFGGVIQIVDFTPDQIVGKIYYKENVEIIWNKLEDEIGFEESQIIGEWERIENPIPPPLIDDKEEYFEKELLSISKERILRYEGFRADTLSWELNRGKNIIILNNDYEVERRIGRQWIIISIEKDTLTLNRKVKSFYDWSSNVSTDKFKRKE